jgi:hypothetical protein
VTPARGRSAGLGLLAAAALAAGAPATAPTSAAATAPAPPADLASLTRVERLQLLEVDKAKLALDQARADMAEARSQLDEVRTLFEERIYTKDDLAKAEQKHRQAVLAYQRAQIELEQKRLDFLKDATLVSVVDAVKYRGEAGRVMAAVTLRNDSDLGKARIAMAGERALSPERLASLLKVDNVVVTLRGETWTVDEEGRRISTGTAIVGDPFQQIVRELRHGERKQLAFRLLNKDAESVTVSLEFLGERKQYDVFLKMESRQDLPEVTSGQYSQIGRLGDTVTYTVSLKRLAKTEQAYALTVLGLPREIKARFRAAASEAMLTEVLFNEEITKQSLDLELSIPEKLDPNLVDVRVPFAFLAMTVAERKKLAALKRRHGGGEIPAEALAKIKAAKLQLTIIPRGVGRLEIVSPNLFTEVKQGEEIWIKFNVVNSGTLVLRNIAAELELPLEWDAALTPAKVAQLAGGQKALFKARVIPSADASVGESTVTVLAEGEFGTEVVEAKEKDFTIRIEAKGSITGTVVLVAVLVVLVVGIAVASIKISRR